ncbi:MAG: pilin [Firmicutes bacterium]|nr:pilin [Bacillota bacterium]
MQKTLSIAILIVFMLGTAFNVAYGDLPSDVGKYTGNAGGAAVMTDVKTTADNIVKFVQGVISVVGVVLFIWAGIIFGTAHGDPQRILLGKKMIAGFVVCLVLVFEAPKIVGAVLGFFGFTPPAS